MDVLPDTCGRRDVRSLLFLYLFLLRATADLNCPKPQGGENIILGREALLKNSFPEDSEVSLVCSKGYVRESGSGSISCIGGHWSEPDLVCRRKDCGNPADQPNMSFNISTGTLFGDIIEVICDKGYSISGAAFKQCYDSGWSGRSTCDIVTCEKPGEVTNGKTSWDSEDDPEYGQTIHYSCNDGYTLTGKGDIICSETGEYDHPPPDCEVDAFVAVTTEDIIDTNVIRTTTTTTPTTSPTQEASTATESSAHRDKTIITSAPLPTVSPSARGADVSTAEGKSAPTSATSTTPASLRELEKHDEAVDADESTGYTPVIISVICVLLVVCILVFFLHKFILRRHGSYDTREDQKPELLHFQNL